MDQRAPTSPKPARGSRSFSFRSDKSGGSANKPNIDSLAESPREKERRDSIWKSESKANPNAALAEAQPGEINLLEKTTIEPLRQFQHKDTKGNVITDPDLSNPTRPRFERPLDTIRSFERAIDHGYKRRSSLMRSESDQNNSQYASRRSSYYGGQDASNRQSLVGGGFYGGRRPDNFQDGPSHAGQQRMRYGPRMQSDSQVFMRPPNAAFNSQHAYHQSHDTAMTGASDSTGTWNGSTNPSSENSSIERVATANRPYGQDMPDAIMEENTGNYPGGHPLPRPPVEQRRPIPLTSGPPPPSKGLPITPRPEPEKKKSWLQRRFSKKA